jgi:2-dehydro-3-deoxyphosphogalactonate aldolase
MRLGIEEADQRPTPLDRYRADFAACPLIAILRGLRPDEAEAVGAVLLDAGVRIMEVPLNSPEPLASIERLARAFGERATIGAGTVLDPTDVARIRDVGGRIIVSPHVDAAVIEETVRLGLVSAPGYLTPTEAFAALRAGAHVLKLFPAGAVGPAMLKAQREVLPREVPVLAVGGVAADDVGDWLAAGAAGFGLGSGLYKAGMTPSEVGARARTYVAALAANSLASTSA